ncbi:MAG: ketose-bisphosphate aldolase [Alphaproteobacteria bacterium]|nr:ketose-bisphosphate aldolase [Alphaproteobacteria bacterium]
MNYKDFGLVNTRAMFADAIARKYAVPAFNFYNMETLSAILEAARTTHSPVILAVSESAMKYMGDDLLMGMIWGKKFTPESGVALHLDHGGSFEACAHAIELGFSSVMIDGSKLPFEENVALARRVAELAHAHDVSVEAELGTLAGIEDENTHSETSSYTDPADVIKFVEQTGCDSLAIAIGTSHGAYKRKSDDEKLRFDILAEIADKLPNFPLVLHGASSIPQHFVKTINEFGGDIAGARGIDPTQLRMATEMNICKINVDSDSRLAFTAGIRRNLAEKPAGFNPRDYLGAGRKLIVENCIDEIKNIMGSDNKLN